MIVNSSKPQLRRHFRSARNTLTPEQQRAAAHRLAVRLARHPWYRTAKHIALYWPSDGEISPLPLVTRHALRTKSFYLPCIGSNNQMTFHRYRPGDRLTTHSYGMQEPSDRSGLRNIKSMDLVLMPLVAFDVNGNRLGMGGGYYDRALKACPLHPKRIGLAHSLQQADQPLPKEPWDIRLHAIATDSGIITYPK